MKMNKEELKVGFEFLQPIIDAGENLPFSWDEKYEGYYNIDNEEVLLSDSKLYCVHTLQRDRMILKYESGEIEIDEEYNQLKKWQEESSKIKIVDENGNDASIFNVGKYIKSRLAPKECGRMEGESK